jgi:hypothetical protein
MNRLMGTLAVAIGLLVCGSLVLSADPPAPPQLSKVVPADDLVARVRAFDGELQTMLADEKTYQDESHKVKRDAHTLSAVAMVLGLYDTDHELKSAAPALLKAARELAAAPDYAAAKQAGTELHAALTEKKSAAEPVKPEKVASMGQLMKQVTFVNNRLKRGMRRLNDKTDEKAHDAALLAAIAQAIVYDTHEVKKVEQQEDWYRFCGEMRDAAGELNAKIKAADKQGADAALKRLGQSCDTCHQVFRPEQK